MDRFPVLDELFTPFIAAIRAGDISAYDIALDKWERRLLELNLWLTLERARELCIRGLFRRVYVDHRPVSDDTEYALTTLIKLGGNRSKHTDTRFYVPLLVAIKGDRGFDGGS